MNNKVGGLTTHLSGCPPTEKVTGGCTTCNDSRKSASHICAITTK